MRNRSFKHGSMDKRFVVPNVSAGSGKLEPSERADS
jgi:hypothetical protein